MRAYSFKILISFFLVVTTISIAPAVYSQSENIVEVVDVSEEGFEKWLEGFYAEAKERGVKENIIKTALDGVKLKRNVVKLDRMQPERTITFKEYVQRVIPSSRIRKGRRLLKVHKVLLDEISKKYGVQPRFIIALWGIETDFGANTGGFYVPEVLATLSYEGRRRGFFTNELFNSLKIIEEGHIAAKKMKGSWAGAMGQSQFMPSSFSKYAVDYNGDGKKDIWNTLSDVFASMANYLKTEGWSDELTWGRKVELPAGFDITLADLKITKSLKEWNSLGVTREDGRKLPVKNLNASIVLPGGKGGGAFLVYDNYKVILHWNKSKYFATSVGLLSDALVAK